MERPINLIEKSEKEISEILTQIEDGDANRQKDLSSKMIETLVMCIPENVWGGKLSNNIKY